MLKTTKLSEEIDQARREIEEGEGIPHEEVMSSLKERLRQLKRR